MQQILETITGMSMFLRIFVDFSYYRNYYVISEAVSISVYSGVFTDM